MRQSTSNQQELRVLLAQMDQCIVQADQDLAHFRSWFQDLQVMGDNIAKLENFYFKGDWPALTEKAQTDFPNEPFECCSEDRIWEISQAFYYLKLALVKHLSDGIYAQIPDAYRENGTSI